MSFAISAAAVLAVAVAGSVFGSMRWLKVGTVEISTDKLNENGLKILHLSDIHSTRENKLHYDFWRQLAAADVDFDLVAITGDFVQDYAAQAIPHLPYIKALASRAPVYYVPGNHDRNHNEELLLCKMLTDAGVTVLRNARAVAQINQNTIEIIGTKDYEQLEKEKMHGLHGLFHGTGGKKNKPDFTLVLSHQPQIIRHISKYKPDLVLCGHTHGGQVRFPFLPALYAPGQGLFPKYDHGLYKVDESVLYISKGIGATHFHIRFFNRPEITLLKLQSNTNTK